MSILTAQIVGYLGKDAELKYTSNGQAVANFSVAASRKRGGEETTTWVRVALWGKAAESLAPYLTKGQAVFAQGETYLREYESNGKSGVSLEMNANTVQLVGKKSDGENQGGKAQRAAAPASAPQEEDPFPF